MSDMLHPQERPPVESRTGAKVMVFLILGAFFGCVLLWHIYGDGSSRTAQRHGPFDAQIMCQRFVKNQLKAPSTAKFPSNPSVAYVGNNCYYMSSHVEAQNAFGVPIRNGFTCEVCYAGSGKYTLKALDFYD